MVNISEELHRERMRSLVEYTASSLETEYPSPFGASIYDAKGNLVIEVYDTVIKDCDPSSHGEMNAVRLATKKIGQLSLKGCVLYATCEPCIMCMAAIIWAEIDVVVFGASVKEDARLFVREALDMTAQELSARMYEEPKCKVIPFVEREQCIDLFRRWKEALDTKKLSDKFNF